MKEKLAELIYKTLSGRIYNPLMMINIKPVPLVLKNTDKCLVIAPHPDDESIGCGGIISLHPGNFDVLCLTHGAQEDIRFKEMHSAMDFAGVKNLMMLNLPDKNVLTGQAEFNKIDISRYDYIFMPFMFDQHKDHKAASLLLYNRLKSGCRFKKSLKILFYEVWAALHMPQYYIDITAAVNSKISMINFHKSQIISKDYASKIIGLNQYRGLLKNISAAECFAGMDCKDFMKTVSAVLC